jgi:hypothetical protein
MLQRHFTKSPSLNRTAVMSLGNERVKRSAPLGTTFDAEK